MAVTQNSYTGNGSTTNYSFTFPYLKQSEIKASLDATVTTAFTIPNATTIQFNTAPASGVKIKIYRETDSDSLAATFYAGSAIKSEDLNDNFTQNLYATQEVAARYLSNLGGTMTGDLQLGEDVVIKFEGATDNAHETTLTVVDPTADRTITLPNVTGTVVTTGDTGTVATSMIAGDAVTGAKIADDQINSEHYVDGSIDTAHIADLQVTTDKLASNAVTTVKILDANVTTAKIADANVTTAKIAADAITGAKIADDQINSEHYVAASIDTEHIADANVTTAKIADDAVTAAKLANTAVTAGSYTAADITVDAQGRVTSAASGAIATSEITDSAVTTAKIADANVTTAKITDANVTTAKIADANVTTAKITDANVTTAKIADSNVTTAKIADSNVTTAKIADGNVTTAKLAADAIDATKIADNAVTTDHIQDAELTTLAGMPSGTASILADSTALTSTTTELNQLDGKTLGETTLTTNSNTAIPTSKAVNDRILTVTNALGGFVAIANETSFPATHPDPSDGAGTVVSVSDAGGVVVNGSGVASITNGAGSGNTVTINGFPSSLYSKTLGAGIGLQVQTTTTLHTYDYHKILAKEADVEQLSGDINDFNERYRVAGSAPGSNNDAGDLYFDTSANKMKVYNATTSAWDDVASVGNFYINTISSSSGTGGGSATFNGSAYRFTLSNAPTMAQQLIVSVNGVIQKPNAGSSQPSEGFAVSGNDIIFSAAPASGSDYFIVTQGSSVSIGTPSDNTVSTAKIQNQAVTTAKITDANVTTAKLADANVTNAKIADDTIAEGKLDVHNAPATGKYLKYTSNGMEWADGASEGTDVKSTGESGTTKFLRVDGDGTCSWQVPPDTNTQVGGATAVDFDDNVKARFGTGNDLEIYHDGNHSQIRDVGTGNLQLLTSTFKALSSDGGETYITAVRDGAVECYYDNSKKLETTSSGINVTGSINVNGAALATAPTITATASGAISDQAAVAINSSGQAVAVAETISENNPPTGHQFLYQDSGPAHHANNSGGKWPLVKWDNSVKVAVAINMMAGGNTLRLTTGRITGNSLDWDIPTGHAISGSATQTQFLETNGSGLFLVGLRSNANGQTYFFPVQVASDGTITKSNGQQPSSDYIDIDGLNETSCDIVWTGSQFVIAWQHTGGDLKFNAITVSGAAGSHTLSFGSEVAISNPGGVLNPRLTWDPDTSRVICTYRAVESGTSKNKYVMLSASGNTVTKYTEAEFGGTSRYDEYGDVVYDEHQNRVIHMWMKDGSGDQDRRIYVNAGTVTGGSTNTISWSSDSDAGYRGAEGYVVYDSTVKKVVMFWNAFSTSSSPNDQVFSRIIGGSGTTISYGTGGSILVDNDCRVEHPRGCYCPAENKHITIARRPIGSATGISILSTAGTASTNMSSTSEFVGFASQAYTNGQTATINVVGNTATKSGLTAGTKYYVQDDGSLGTTAGSHSVVGGIALSSTKLLIK